MAKHLKPGAEVIVPWGAHSVKGVVIDIYGPPGDRHVLVRVPVTGSTGETLETSDVTFPERTLSAHAS